ncbi:D-2-hydroxyacid dehydrogenase [Arcobacter sp. FWKO B]|uniref:D-2-hydroxyacid dehydrogenase n=1 Tax=Arcobacter sp. FWKO B TaxID=2593672 RepID=UPI0018A4C847|nr:D-2-hydroxyacid dehydrogenase [Arcobacter sp. FWKO B]QOG12229.1 D-2-hydroxyacid dehydrogenase [Arcobacter sp. FWKO B]
MKVVFIDFDTLGCDIDIRRFEEFGEVVTYGKTKYEQTIDRLKNADIVITNKVVIDKAVIDATNLKLICVAATGMNNIDLEYASQKGITVKNVKGYSTASVVQLTFALALHFVQKIDYYSNYTKSGKWCESEIFANLDVPFYELENKKWGIIGLGEIGKKVASIAKAFDCEVNYYSTSGTNYNTNYNMLTLEELLKTSDIISIHAPLNNTTKNMLNYTNLELLKNGAIVLNLGRGGIINENDMAKIIDTKDVYFGIDVLEKEPMLRNHPLLNIQNKEQIVVTPHIGWASIEARQRLVEGIFKNIKEYVL